MGICPRPVQGTPCGRPKLVNPVTAREYGTCYWHRISRTSITAQIREANKRLEAAQEPHRARVPELFWPKGERWCAGCQSYVPLWYCPGSRCKACTSKARHGQHVEKTYGIGPEAWNDLLKLQDGKCAICRKRQLDRTIATDHDHKTGDVRGLLCKRCNHDLLGAAFDSVNILRAAIHYLENPPTSGRWVAPEDQS
jgi:Recombination endonuclease VII